MALGFRFNAMASDSASGCLMRACFPLAILLMVIWLHPTVAARLSCVCGPQVIAALMSSAPPGLSCRSMLTSP